MSYSITPQYVCLPREEQWHGAILDVDGHWFFFGDVNRPGDLSFGHVRASGHWADLMDVPDHADQYPDDAPVTIRELSLVVRCMLGASRDKAQRLFEAEMRRQEEEGPEPLVLE